MALTGGFRAVTTADLAPGATRCLDVDGVGILVARAQDGQYFAVDRNCSHVGLPLDAGRVRGASIVCPHHGARFDLKSGRVLGPPAAMPIGVWPTRVSGDSVEIWWAR